MRSKETIEVYGRVLPIWVMLDNNEMLNLFADWYKKLPKMVVDEYFYKSETGRNLEYPEKYNLTKRR
jgi:hypothetical protein